MSQDIRWKQRFENFKKAYGYFKASIVDEDPHSFSIREKLGVVQEFEMILELSWKVLKDFLEEDGVVLPSKSPKSVLKKAFEAGLIVDEEEWLQMIDDRNVFVHAYAPDHFEEAINKFESHYFILFSRLYETFKDIE